MVPWTEFWNRERRQWGENKTKLVKSSKVYSLVNSFEKYTMITKMLTLGEC